MSCGVLIAPIMVASWLSHNLEKLGVFSVPQFEWPETASPERRSCKNFLGINMESCVLGQPVLGMC